jgi:hypothetical protein
MSWEPGRGRVRELIDTGEVEQVTPDLAIARRMLEDASRHLATASQAKMAGDLSGAYQLAYDALRKSAASLLEAQGLRATSRGGHLAVQEVVIAQFGTTVRIFRSFGRVRRARNSFEYRAATVQALPATTSTMPSPLPPRHAKRPSPSSTRMFWPAGDTGRHGRPACWQPCGHHGVTARRNAELHVLLDDDMGILAFAAPARTA